MKRRSKGDAPTEKREWTAEELARSKAAWTALRGVSRPPEMRPDVWLMAQPVLSLLCWCARFGWDRIWPSQEWMAGRLQVPQTTISRSLVQCAKHGLIIRHPNDWGRYYSTRYELSFAMPKPGIAAETNTVVTTDPTDVRQSDSANAVASDRQSDSANDVPTDSANDVSRTQLTTSVGSGGPIEIQELEIQEDATNDDDGSSSSSTSKPAEEQEMDLPPLAPGEVRVWESDGSSLSHEPDADGPQHTCTACGRKHNRWTAKEGCVRCGTEVLALAGYLDGDDPICADCDLPPAARRQRDALKARRIEIMKAEARQIRADMISVPSQYGYTNLVTWPEGYVFPKWDSRFKPPGH